MSDQPNRVKLVLVDEIPEDLIALCIPDINSILNEYDQDVVRGMCERNLIYKLSDSSVVYTNPLTDITDIYFKDVTKINSPQLLLIMAKYPNAQIVLFLTKENEKLSQTDPCLSVYETNYNELIVENWREENTVLNKPRDTILDAKEIIEKFKNEINEIFLNSYKSSNE